MSLPDGSTHGETPDDGVAMSAVRGWVLVGAAVVVGLLIFLVVDGSGSLPSTVGRTPAIADGTTSPGAEDTTATTEAEQSQAAARSNDQVVVQVLNGSGVQGAATQRSDELGAQGYQVLPAGNAPETREGTAVQCAEGYEKEAAALVEVLSVIGVQATPEALASPLPSGFDASANCYVILGA